MGKKYIIELEDKPFHKEDGDFLYRVKGFNSLVFDMTGIGKLTPYTAPNLERVREFANKIGYKKGYRDGVNRIGDAEDKIRKEAYEQGQKDLRESCVPKDEEAYGIGYNEGFQCGLDLAWYAAKKIIRMPEADLLNLFTECYSAVCTPLQVFLKYDASECIEKIRQYEQEEEEQIQVGDEVIRHYKNEFMEGDDTPSIFLSEEDGHFRCLAFNGRSIMIAEYPKNQYRKTGRHFPEIATILEKMRGE